MKEFILRFYAYVLCYYTQTLLLTVLPLPRNFIVERLILLIVSQAGYSLLMIKFSQKIIHVESEISEGRMIGLVFRILVYLYGNGGGE